MKRTSYKDIKQENSIIDNFAHVWAGLSFLLAALVYYDDFPLYVVLGNIGLGFVFLFIAAEHCTPYCQIQKYLNVEPLTAKLTFKVLAVCLIISSVAVKWQST